MLRMSRRWILALVLLALALAAAVGVWRWRAPTVPAAAVQAAPLVRTLLFSARVATESRVELGSTLQTRIKNVALYGAPSNTGSPVVAGLDADDVSVVAVGTNHVRVSITYVFQPAIGNALVNPFGADIPLNLTLTSSVVMRAL